MIIDAHAHIYPDKIAERAVGGIESFYGMNVGYNGTLSTLLDEGAAAGVDRFLVQSVATVPEQVVSINNFIVGSVKAFPDKLIGFGAMHPDFPDVRGETERIISLGLKGIKLHSDFQRFNIDDERAFSIYECAEDAGLPILFHVGDNRYDFSSPERLMNVVKRFPRLKVIGAHLAGWSMWDKGAEIFAGSGIYADCSSSLYALEPEHAAELIRKLGTDRVLWGTDYPMWSAKDELERFDKLPLTDEERENILSRNVRRLIGEINN
ncbi:MAG: amidohydrolase family protein [Ruminococcus sp.]|nr:amidohydrolase family protein [Ruminococcus sp.]